MRRFVAVLVVAGLALTLTACGGGDDGGEAPASSSSAAAPPPPPVSAEELAPNRTPLAEVKFEPLPRQSRESTSLPAAVIERLDSGQPMLLFFFDTDQKTADDQRHEIDALLKEYRGTIDLLAYDIGQSITDGEHDEKDAEAVTLARAVEVDFTPYVIFIDGQGLVTWRHRGFVDREVMERELLRATN